MNSKHNFVVIGSGFSSLAAACYLAKAGKKVTVLEKNEQLGGRASVLEENGFRFDMGPSWYWMPDVFEKFFADFGLKVADFYELEKLNPAYRVYFGENDFIDISEDLNQIISTFDAIDEGSGERLKKFLNQAEKNYEIAMQDLVYQPGISITELVTAQTTTRLPLFFKNISSQASSITKNKKLQSILEFPVLFLGAKPQNTPAFYNFMNWADFGLGTWYPKGGMNQIVQAMVKLATDLGVDFQLNEDVTSINIHNKKVTSVTTNNAVYECDAIISGADYAHTEKLINQEFRNIKIESWKKKTFAPSAFLYYLGLKEEIKNVEHHNLFFDTDFEQHAKEIYDEKSFPTSPLFYLNFPSKTDESLALNGMATAFLLIPVAVDLDDNVQIHQEYLDKVLERFEKCTGENLKEKIVFQKSFGVNDFKNRYNSCRGNAYGLANTLLQTSVLRPSIRNKNVENLFYTGQLTVPGPGVPPALISGKIVAEYAVKTLNDRH